MIFDDLLFNSICDYLLVHEDVLLRGIHRMMAGVSRYVINPWQYRFVTFLEYVVRIVVIGVVKTGAHDERAIRNHK